MPMKGKNWAQHIPWQGWVEDRLLRVLVQSRLEMVGLLLMQDGKLDRPRLEGANSAAEVLHIDESGENRHSFHSVQVSDPRRIGLYVTNSERWESLVAEV